MSNFNIIGMYVTSLSKADQDALDVMTGRLEEIGVPPLTQFTQATDGTDALLKLYRQTPRIISDNALAVIVVGDIGEWGKFWRTLRAKPKNLPIYLILVCPLSTEIRDFFLHRLPKGVAILMANQ